MQRLYISHKILSDGEIVVQAKKVDGSLNFGFRTRDHFGWQTQARAWSGEYLPTFLAKGENLINGRVVCRCQ